MARADLLRSGLQRLLMGGAHLGLELRIEGQAAQQDEQPAQRQPRTTPPQVAEVDLSESKVSLDRVTVLADQSDEVCDSPDEPNPIALAIRSDNSFSSDTLRFRPRTVRHCC